MQDCKKCSSKHKGVFCHLEESSLDEISKHKMCLSFSKSEPIFSEGDEAKGLYCILSGRVKVYKSSANGGQQILRIAQAGSLLGYRAIFAHEVYQANAEAMEDTQACLIDKKAFFSVLEKSPNLSLDLMKKLAKELGMAESLASNMVHKTVKERMAELLIMLKDAYGVNEARGVKLNIVLTREEMAEMIGTTQETAIRLLSDFKKQKLIEISDRKIMLKNVESLYEIAQLDV